MFFYVLNFLIVYPLIQTTPLWANTRPISLYYAAELGDSTRVIHLLNQGVPIDEPDNKGRTALIYAASRGHLTIVKMLLARGANVHAEGQDQLSPLNAAIKRNHIDIVKLLLDAGVDIHLSDLIGIKPLQIAVELGHTDMVQMLLEKGADPNTLSDKAVPMLRLAYNHRHTAIAEKLLQYGATPQIQSPITPSNFNLPITDTLAIRKTLEKGVEPAMALRLSVELGDTTAIRQLLESNIVNINAPTEGHVTPLMIAVGRGNMLIVQTLIDAGADLFAQDEKYRTVLAYSMFIKDRPKRKQMQMYLHQQINSRFIKR